MFRFLGEYDNAVAARADAAGNADAAAEAQAANAGADPIDAFHLALDESFSMQTVTTSLNRHVLPAAARSAPLTVAVNVSCYAPFPEVDKMFFDLMVLGHLTPDASADVFAVPLGSSIRLFVEVPAPVDVVDEQAPLASTRGDARVKAGIITHLTMLRDAAEPHHVDGESPFLVSPSLRRTLRCVASGTATPPRERQPYSHYSRGPLGMMQVPARLLYAPPSQRNSLSDRHAQPRTACGACHRAPWDARCFVLRQR